MSWSFKIGRVFGIGLYVHFTFLLLLAFLGFGAYAASGSTEFALYQVGFILILFGIVVLHELGHALAARAFGIPTKDITLLPIGGLARLARIPRDPLKEFVIAIAGPAVNIVLGLVAFFAVLATYGNTPWGLDEIVGGNLLNRLFWVNVMIVAFNMVPAFPMDGGRVLRALLAMVMNHGRATRIAAGIGQTLAVIVGIGALFVVNPPMPMLALIALFVWMGAGQEAALVTAMEFFSGATARQAMMTRFETLSPRDPAGWALQQATSGLQKDFPVLEDGRLVGMLNRMDLREVLRNDEWDAAVGEVMQPVGPTLHPEDPLEQVMERFQEERTPILPVMEEGRLVGLVTVENLQEFLATRQLLRNEGVHRRRGMGRAARAKSSRGIDEFRFTRPFPCKGVTPEKGEGQQATYVRPPTEPAGLVRKDACGLAFCFTEK